MGTRLKSYFRAWLCVFIASQLVSQYVEQRPTFINHGISGNQLSNLYGRWNEYAFTLQPNIISILIGINDAAAVI